MDSNERRIVSRQFSRPVPQSEGTFLGNEKLSHSNRRRLLSAREPPKEVFVLREGQFRRYGNWIPGSSQAPTMPPPCRYNAARKTANYGNTIRHKTPGTNPRTTEGTMRKTTFCKHTINNANRRDGSAIVLARERIDDALSFGKPTRNQTMANPRQRCYWKHRRRDSIRVIF